MARNKFASTKARTHQPVHRVPEQVEQAPVADLFAETDRKLLALGGEKVARWQVEIHPFADEIGPKILARGEVFERLGR